MEIRIKETLYIKDYPNVSSYIVQEGAVGVIKEGVVYFYDVTKNHSVGFARNVCLQDSGLFSVKKHLGDREVPISEVLKLVSGHKGQVDEGLIMQLKSL